MPPKFWEQLANSSARAAHQIMDLVKTCQEWGVLVETPMVGFALYNVAVLGVYSTHFPWMDPTSQFAFDPTLARTMTATDTEGVEVTRKALELIGLLRPRLQMANGWFMTLYKMHQHFVLLKQDYSQSTQHLAASTTGSTSHIRTIRPSEYTPGGAYKFIESVFRDIGGLGLNDVYRDDVYYTSTRRGNGSMPKGDEVGSADGGATNGTYVQQPDHARQEERWNAINKVAAAAAASALSQEPQQAPTMPPSTNGQFRSYQPHTGLTEHQSAVASQRDWTASNGGPLAGIHAYASQPAASHNAVHETAEGVDEKRSLGHQQWDLAQMNEWLGKFEMRLGGDDVAAFVQGVEIGEYAAQRDEGWLSTVWKTR